MAFTSVAAETLPNAQSGASIYQDGRDDGPAIEVRLADRQLRFPATSLRCASCHGLDGTGKREGANRVPPVTAQVLSASRPASADWPARPAYDAASLATAVTDGIDPAGRPLSVAMPRYTLSDPQRAALIAYLMALGRGDPLEVGVTPTVIRIGSALPLSGPRAAAGEALRQMLTTLFARSSETGIYGRRLELVTADTAAAGERAAVTRLIEVDHVFALVATQLPRDMTGLDPQVPIIGDLDATTRPPSPRAFRIAAPIADRIAILLRQAEQCDGPNLRLAVIDAAPAEHELVAAGTSDVVLEWHDPARPEAAIAAARAAGAQAILVLAPRETLTALLGAGVTLPLLVPGQPDDDAVAGAAMIPASDGAPNVRLAFVGLAPAQIDDTAFRSVMPPRAGGGERSLLRYEAYASAVVFQEAVKTAGRRLDRAALVEALEALRDVRTGVMPAVSFAPNRHDGLSGAAVVGFTGDGHATFLAPWRDAESLSRSAAECRSALK